MWSLRIIASKEIALEIERTINEEALSLSCLEKDEKKPIWEVQILCAEEKEASQLLHSLPFQIQNSVTWEIAPLEQKNWLEENRKSFPAIEVGSFYIYGAHLKDKTPSDKIGLQLDASTAFGTGEHATTKGCLQAIEDISKTRAFEKPIDIGCGTGILALGLAALLKLPVIAVDNDPEAIRKTLENSAINNLSHLVTAYVSEGWEKVTDKEFDLVAANILADPLCELAPSMNARMRKKGVIILSGLLRTQKEQVIQAYRLQDFEFIRNYPIGEWETLILTKK